jgi:hypothetical protein
LAALQAIHVREASMQFDHAVVASARMQSVDVLRNGSNESPCAMQARERAMSGVRFRCGEGRPAEQTARPVSASRLIGTQEISQLDWRAALPHTVFTAVIADAGRRAQTGAGQHEQIGMLYDERGERRVHASM